MTKKDYSKWDRYKLIKEIEQLHNRKKYGLVWEDKPEDVVEQCKELLPVLVEVEKKIIEKEANKSTNLIIEGDNYHSLSVLSYTHAGKIDVIYADPPYNTGAKNWIYNNNYVDGNDTFRHSKWLSFMEKRLRLARSLLKTDGIIVITIDDYEVATLTLLMNEIFGEENHLGTVVIKNNPQGRSSVSGFQISHEYALFYGRTPKAKIGRLPRTQDQIDRYKKSDSIGEFEWRNFRAQYSTESPKMKYPIFVKKDCSDFRIPKIKWNEKKQSYDLLEKPDDSEQISLSIDSNGRSRTWKWSIDTVRSNKDTEMGVRLDKDKKPSVYYKGRMKEKGMLPYTIWDKPEYSSASMGTNLLKSLLGEKKFDYPKSLYATIDTLIVSSVKKKKKALILDFFAGSGTTGHAVLELNKKDRGNRQFILCTNNENKIAEEVTYQRIKTVIEGYENTDGIPANLRYFKTSFVKKSLVSDDTRKQLVKKSAEMICIKEGTFKKKHDNKDFKIYEGTDHITGILFNLDQIETFKKKIASPQLPAHIYVFSLTNDTFDEDFDDLDLEHTLCPIPESILEVYIKIFS
jgi:adenine-specific DNA-methyltransferase